MIVRSVNHISFSVSDLDASLHFYRDILGLVDIPRPDFGIPGAWLGAGDAHVHLIARPEGADVGTPPDSLTPIACHQAFGVEDYQKTLDHLKSHGLEVLETSPEQGQMWVRDPDGYVIEFTALG